MHAARRDDISARQVNGLCRAILHARVCRRSEKIAKRAPPSSLSPSSPRGLLTLNGLFRNISRGISFRPLRSSAPLLSLLSAIPLRRNLVKTVSDWVRVGRRLSIPL